jgi:phosphatidate cytidylyltransferase
MSSSPNERPDAEDHAPEEPGTSRMPGLGARLAASTTPPARDRWADRHDDTGPVPITGERPLFPPSRPSRPDPVEPADVEPAGVELPTDLPTTEQPAAPATGSRAGRNLGAAIGVGLSLGAVIVVSLVGWRPAFLGVLGAAVLVGVVELTRALRKGGFRAPLVPLLVGAVAMVALAWTRGPTGLVTGFLLTALAVVLWRLADGPAGYLRDSSAGVLVALYVPLLAGFAALLLAPEDGAARVFTFIATVVASDVGGYAAGVLFGKHPMAPSISPKKSWEGMAGSVLACMGIATLLIALWLGGPWWAGLVFGAAIAVSATVGDLAESLIKRDLGIKDMGDLLPGHGGLMDRLDSLLPSAAVAYLLLALFVPL